MQKITLEDHGQDFLYWDIENGEVVGCGPFQEWLWKGTKVLNANVKKGDTLQIKTKCGYITTLNYPVASIINC